MGQQWPCQYGSFSGSRLDTDTETGSVKVDLSKMDEKEDDSDYDYFSSGDDDVIPETQSSRHPLSTLQREVDVLRRNLVQIAFV